MALVSFDRSATTETAAIRALFPELIAEASARGGVPYRAHLTHMDLISDQYDHNHHALRRLQERVKDALDPDGLLVPGKQGIWPARDRAA